MLREIWPHIALVQTTQPWGEEENQAVRNANWPSVSTHCEVNRGRGEAGGERHFNARSKNCSAFRQLSKGLRPTSALGRPLTPAWEQRPWTRPPSCLRLRS